MRSLLLFFLGVPIPIIILIALFVHQTRCISTKPETEKTITATATKKTAKRNSPPKGQDATTLLRADHKLVSGLFAEYEKTRSTAKKKQLVSQICTELTVHAQVDIRMTSMK